MLSTSVVGHQQKQLHRLLSERIIIFLSEETFNLCTQMGKVQTVLDLIDANLLGKTLTHEHLGMDYEQCYMPGPENFKEFTDKRISMETLGFVRQYPYSSKENLHLNDLEGQAAVLKDVHLYKKFGGGAIAENSTYGLKRDLAFIVDVSKKTDVHIIAGTGHYLHFFQDPSNLNLSVEQLTELYTNDIALGKEIESVGIVKCGFIGEIASEYPIHDFEKKAIRATGEAQEVLGCGVSFHPGRNEKAPFEIMRLYLEAGGKAEKCVLSHLDRTIYDINNLLEFSKLKSYLQYDLFGTEVSFYQFHPSTDMPSDAQRMDNLKKLIEEGLIDRITLSHDIHTKHRLTSYGGHGYHHLHTNVLPRLLHRGLSPEDIERLSVKNPAEWLKLPA